MKSKFNCPVCDYPLEMIQISIGGASLWCGHGRCDSFEANQPETAETEEQAYRKLVVRVMERENQPD